MAHQDSGFSEEDADHHVTTCLMKTPSGSIYIQPTSRFLTNFPITLAITTMCYINNLNIHWSWQHTGTTSSSGLCCWKEYNSSI